MHSPSVEVEEVARILEFEAVFNIIGFLSEALQACSISLEGWFRSKVT